MNKKVLALSVLLLASAGAVSAIAAGGGGMGMGEGRGEERGWYQGGHGKEHGRSMGGRRGGQAMMRLKRLDTDNDGAVSLDEFMKPRLERFATLDKGADGVLDAVELTARMQEKAAHRARMMMAKLDANGDGKVTKEEFDSAAKHHRRGHRFGHEGGRRFHRDRADAGGAAATGANPTAEAKPAEAAPADAKAAGRGDRGARRAQMFARLDANGDGTITMADIDTRSATGVAYAQKKRLHVLDKDRDGKISREEFSARSKQRFADLDLDSDGKITASDLPPRMAERWQKGPDRR